MKYGITTSFISVSRGESQLKRFPGKANTSALSSAPSPIGPDSTITPSSSGSAVSSATANPNSEGVQYKAGWKFTCRDRGLSFGRLFDMRGASRSEKRGTCYNYHGRGRRWWWEARPGPALHLLVKRVIRRKYEKLRTYLLRVLSSLHQSLDCLEAAPKGGAIVLLG